MKHVIAALLISAFLLTGCTVPHATATVEKAEMQSGALVTLTHQSATTTTTTSTTSEAVTTTAMP